MVAGIATLVCLTVPRTTDRWEPRRISFVEGHPKDVIAAIRQTPHAVVFLDAMFSPKALMGRREFQEAATRLTTAKLPPTTFFVLDEWPIREDYQVERELVQDWLGSLHLKDLLVGQGYPRGSGSLLWLENGHVVFEEVSAMELKAPGIIDRTRKLWGRGQS